MTGLPPAASLCCQSFDHAHISQELSRALTPGVLRCSGAPVAQQSMGAKPRRHLLCRTPALLEL